MPRCHDIQSPVTIFPKTRLSELVGRFGGLSREEAVEAATRELEGLKPESDKAILSSIAELEKTVAGTARRGDIVPVRDLLPLCDQIVTLVGIFGYGALDKAARSLCDLLGDPTSHDQSILASILVRMQTVRLFATGAAPLDETRIDDMLREVGRLLDHHGCATKIDGGDCAGDFIEMAKEAASRCDRQ